MRAAVSLGAFAARCSLYPDRSALRPAVRAEYRSYPAAFFHPRTEISTGLTLVELRGGGSGGTLGSGASTSFALTAQFFHAGADHRETREYQAALCSWRAAPARILPSAKPPCSVSELRSKYLNKSFMEKPALYWSGLIVAVLYYPWPGYTRPSTNS